MSVAGPRYDRALRALAKKLWVQTSSAGGAYEATGRRVLALDVGQMYVGVALSDPENRVGLPWRTLKAQRVKWEGQREAYTAAMRKHGGRAAAGVSGRGSAARPGALMQPPRYESLPMDRVMRPVREAVAEFDVAAVVVGLPLLPDGRLSRQCLFTERFVKRMRDEGHVMPPCYFWDERYTTQVSRDILSHLRFERHEERDRVDRLAASLILGDFLHYTRRLTYFPGEEAPDLAYLGTGSPLARK